jgi:hypothetical protein
MDRLNNEVEISMLSITFLKNMGCVQLEPCQLELSDLSSLIAVGIER